MLCLSTLLETHQSLFCVHSRECRDSNWIKSVEKKGVVLQIEFSPFIPPCHWCLLLEVYQWFHTTFVLSYVQTTFQKRKNVYKEWESVWPFPNPNIGSFFPGWRELSKSQFRTGVDLILWSITPGSISSLIYFGREPTLLQLLQTPIWCFKRERTLRRLF